MRDLDPFGSRFDVETTAASAAARAFAKELERTLATLDTSKYEAVEVIQLTAISFGAADVGGETIIRLVESGEPPAKELAEIGYWDRPVQRIARYEAEDIDTLRAYVEHGDRDDVVRLVEEQLDVVDADPERAADRLIESLEQHADEWGEA